ncbi:TetR family transcriptional regulator [Aliidiomarina sp. Khilg15.8]
MARPCKAESDQTRDKILDAAELEFLESGFSRSTLNGIAKRAGVTRGAIYWHFNDKVALFDAMLERVQLPMETFLCEAVRDNQAPLDALYQLCRESILLLLNNPRTQRVYTILFHRCERVAELRDLISRENHMRETMQRQVEQFLSQAQQTGVVRTNTSAEALAWALKSYIIGIYNLWLQAPADMQLENQVDDLLGLFFDGLRPPSY